MTREKFEAFVLDTYGVSADHPFADDPEIAIFRHKENRKWFAAVMSVSRSRLGLDGEALVDIVDLKCAPEVVESIVGAEQGVFPAYHMSKTHWLTATLDGSCDDGTICWLLGISYGLTKAKKKKR